MKRLIKWSAIIGILCCLLGVGMITAGAMMGGAEELWKYKDKMIDGDRYDRSSESTYAAAEMTVESSAVDKAADGSKGRDRAAASGNAAAADSNTASVQAGAGAAAGSQTDAGGEQYTGIRVLKLESVSGEVFICAEERADDTIRIERSDVSGKTTYSYRIRIENGDELEIESDESIKRGSQADRSMESLTLYVPAGYRFREVELELNAGLIEAEQICADKLDIELASGSVQINGGQVGVLDVECKAGDVNCSAEVSERLEAEVKTGSARLQMAGSQADYECELECAQSGTIRLEGSESKTYSGLPKKTRLNQGMLKTVKLECVQGELTVVFPADL